MRGFISKNTALRQNFTGEYLMLDKKNSAKGIVFRKNPSGFRRSYSKTIEVKKIIHLTRIMAY